MQSYAISFTVFILSTGVKRFDLNNLPTAWIPWQNQVGLWMIKITSTGLLNQMKECQATAS